MFTSCALNSESKKQAYKPSLLTECDSIDLFSNLLTTTLSDSLVMEMWSTSDSSRINVFHFDPIPSDVNIILRGKQFNLTKYGEEESRNVLNKNKLLENEIFVNGLRMSEDMSSINVLSLSLGIVVKLVYKKLECKWILEEKIVFDT